MLLYPNQKNVSPLSINSTPVATPQSLTTPAFNPHRYFYVTDNYGVSVVDKFTNRIESTIPVGGLLSGLTLSKDGRRLFC